MAWEISGGFEIDDTTLIDSHRVARRIKRDVTDPTCAV